MARLGSIFQSIGLTRVITWGIKIQYSFYYRKNKGNIQQNKIEYLLMNGIKKLG